MKTPNWSTDTRFFMDTSSLMQDAVEKAVRLFIVPICRRYGIPPIIVAKSAHDELGRLATSKTKEKETRFKAGTALKLIGQLKDSDDIEIVGDEHDDSLADQVFLTKLTELRRKYQLVLFTQDRNLAKDVLSINDYGSVRRTKYYEVFRVEAFRVGNDGKPMRWELSGRHKTGVKYRHFHPQDGFEAIGRSLIKGHKEAIYTKNSGKRQDHFGLGSRLPQPFKLQKQAIYLDETLIDTPIPEIGDMIKNSEGRSLRLTNRLGTGARVQLSRRITHNLCVKSIVANTSRSLLYRSLH